MSIGGDGPAISISAMGSEGQYEEQIVARHRSLRWSCERARAKRL